jgi:hypothetical protein
MTIGAPPETTGSPPFGPTGAPIISDGGQRWSSFLPAERRAAIARHRSLLEAAVSAALPAPFASVASVGDREGLG